MYLTIFALILIVSNSKLEAGADMMLGVAVLRQGDTDDLTDISAICWHNAAQQIKPTI